MASVGPSAPGHLIHVGSAKVGGLRPENMSHILALRLPIWSSLMIQQKSATPKMFMSLTMIVFAISYFFIHHWPIYFSLLLLVHL